MSPQSRLRRRVVARDRLEDACGATLEHLHHGTMENFQRLFGRVVSTEEALRELNLPAA